MFLFGNLTSKRHLTSKNVNTYSEFRAENEITYKKDRAQKFASDFFAVFGNIFLILNSFRFIFLNIIVVQNFDVGPKIKIPFIYKLGYETKVGQIQENASKF